MAYLVDTPLLMRLANVDDPQHTVADQAIITLRRRGEALQTTPQNLIEFRNSATRPVAANGLGLAPVIVEALAAGVTGKQVHDARLVAICHVYGLTHILTFNVPHFARLSAYAPGVIVVDPQAV